MPENLNSLYEYLEKEHISFDKTEFEFQIQSHPDYPSLLAVADTLSFFNIDNGVIPVETTDINLLPEHFAAVLKEENSASKLYFIQTNGDAYFYTKDKKKIPISRATLESRWDNIVLLVEKSITENVVKKGQNSLFWLLPVLCITLFLFTLIQFQESMLTKLFIIFPVIGILFSVAALKDLFGTKSELLNSFCNITSSTSCTTVVSSTKWKIFEIVNFSDLSIVFFTSQFLGLLLFLFSGNVTVYFTIQQILLLAAVPVLLLSVYYQKFVEKKWCPICLAIISIILLELSYLFAAFHIDFASSLSSILFFGLVFISVTTAWFALKKMLTTQKELKEFQLKGNRFMRNYEIFKNTLLTSTQIDNHTLTSGAILLGNPNALLKIRIVTSPFCGYCKEAHTIIESILAKHHDMVCFDIHLNYNSEYENEKSRKVHHQLVTIYHEKGELLFRKALHDWFETKNEEKLYAIPIESSNKMKFNGILDEQFKWNQKNNLTYTPAFIINGYLFPKQYDRKELIHFINELSDDEDFQ